MIAGEFCSQIDTTWNIFRTGGISNSIEVIEQITYLLFLRRLDDLHTLEENKSARPDAEVAGWPVPLETGGCADGRTGARARNGGGGLAITQIHRKADHEVSYS
jgi:hypothetical protein